MNYLIEINVPSEGWKPMKLVRRGTLDQLMQRVRELYPEEDIHDVRIRRIKKGKPTLAALRALEDYWGAPWKQPLLWRTP